MMSGVLLFLYSFRSSIVSAQRPPFSQALMSALLLMVSGDLQVLHSFRRSSADFQRLLFSQAIAAL